MYKTRIKSWGLDKNFKESEVVELFRLKRERDRIGKPSVYTIRGREVDWERVNTYVRRKGLDIARLIDVAVSAPSVPFSARDVSCRTPTPDPGDRFTSPASTTSSAFSSPSTATATLSPQDIRASRSSSTAPFPPSPHRSGSSSLSATPSLTPQRVRAFQLCLSNIYDTVMFEDGDRVWGTTEYWLRNTRSQEWTTAVRVKLALYRDYLQVGGPQARAFRMLNRAFAVLESMSAGIIGTRLFYIINFFFAFSPAVPTRTSASAGSTAAASSPFSTTVVQLVESVCAAGAVAPLSGDGGGGGAGSSGGGIISNRPSASLRFGGTGEAGPSNPGFGSGSASGQGLGGGVGDLIEFRDSAGRFLAKVLERMASAVGVALPKEALLLLEEDADGYPILSEDETRRRLAAAGTHSLTSSSTMRDDLSAADALAVALCLLARRDDARAEEYLGSVVEALVSSTAKEARVLARCAHYHLSRIWKRRGEEAHAREHMRRAVEGSLYCDAFVGWHEAEFLFA